MLRIRPADDLPASARLPADAFERVRAIVSSYRLVETPAIRAAREYGYDIGLLKSTVAATVRERRQQRALQPPSATGHVREAPGSSATPPAQELSLAPSAAEMLRQLAARKVRFVVIGGVAAQLHGSARVTQDLDILYDTSMENLERLASILLRWRAYLRGADPGLPFQPDARTLKGTEMLTLETRLGKLDILQRVAGVGTYGEALPQVDPIPLGDFAVHALSLDALIAAKLATGRPRDKMEVVELQAIRDIAEQQRRALEGEPETLAERDQVP